MKKALPLVVVLILGFWIARDPDGFTGLAQTAVGGLVDMVSAVGSWIIGALDQ